MPNEQADSKYLLLWVCVIISAAIIFVGWIFTVKYNFEKIDATNTNNGQTAEQAVNEVQDMFTGVQKAIDASQDSIKTEIDKQKADIAAKKAAEPVVPEEKPSALPEPEALK